MRVILAFCILFLACEAFGQDIITHKRSNNKNPGGKLSQPSYSKSKVTTRVWQHKGMFTAIVAVDGKEFVVGKADSYKKAKSIASDAAAMKRQALGLD